MRHGTTTISMDWPAINSEVSWPVNHVPLRTAIAHIMKYEQLRNVRCTVEQLIPILHSLAQVQEGVNDRGKVTVAMIKTAFGTMGEHYIVQYSDMGVEGTNGSLIVRNGYRSGGRFSRERANDFCYVDTSTTTVEVNIVAELDHPLNNPEIQRAISIPDDVLQRLIIYLTEQKKKNKKGSKKRKASDSGAGTDNDTDNDNNNTSNINGGDNNDATPTLSDDDVAVRNFVGEVKGPLVLRYILGNRIGQCELSKDEMATNCISPRSLILGLLPPTKDESDDDGEDARMYNRVYDPSNLGRTQTFIPRGSVLVKTEYYNKLKECKTQLDKFLKLFQSEKCVIPSASLMIFILGSITGYGCSDEATIIMLGCAFKLVLHVMGIDITNAQVSKAVPSAATLATYEHALSAGCVAVMRQEMVDNNVTVASITTDHGYKGGLEVLPKIISYAVINAKTATVRRYVIDCDKGSHAAKEYARAIAHSARRFLGDELAEVVEVYSICGDAGGGGDGVTLVHDYLMKEGTMKSDSISGNCTLHSFNKAVQRAGEDILGAQGLGKHNPFQLLFVFSTMMKRCVKQYGRKRVDEMWDDTIEKLKSSQSWSDEAETMHKQAFCEFMNSTEKFSITMIQEPVHTRWGTVGA